MKSIIKTLLISFLLLFTYYSYANNQAQSTSPTSSNIAVKPGGPIKTYRVWISYLDNRPKSFGFLYQVTDSSILYIVTTNKFEMVGKRTVLEIPISAIAKIQTRRDKSVKRGAWIGFAPGFVTAGVLGGLIGAYAGGPVLIIGIGAGLLGGGITALIGADIGSMKMT